MHYNLVSQNNGFQNGNKLSHIDRKAQRNIISNEGEIEWIKD